MDNQETSHDAFLFEEFKALRSQIELAIRELIALEKWAVLSSAVAWSWLSTTQGQNLPGLIFWCPAIMTVLFGLRALGLHLITLKTGHYIACIEKQLIKSQELGWEHFLTEKRPILFSLPSYFFWFLLLAANIAIPMFYVPYLKDV